MTPAGLEQRTDAALQSLASDVQPERDLWPAIEARLDSPATARRAWAGRLRPPSRWSPSRRW